MYTYEYLFFPKTFEEPEIDEFDDRMQWFIASLAKNGQILSAFQNTVKYADHYAYRVVALEMDSIDEKYNNKYTVQFLEEVIEMSAKPPELVFVGENYDIEDCCVCEAPSHYILFSESGFYAPPILCGDCKSPVPLYKFPKTYDNSEYYNLLGWQKVYQSCDRQFMEGIGERHGYKMMNDPDSLLSQEALKYCNMLEEKTGKPFYYYLFRYYSKNKLFCPKCKEAWKNNDQDKIHYEFVCHKCRLVSNDIV